MFTELRVNNEHLINRWIILLIARRLTFSPGSYGKDKEAMRNVNFIYPNGYDMETFTIV